ncbi:MAG: hypothetical protein J5854_07130 [Clostridia bacterium]|nr:hypothetical protein [Clostridia bacterium]
MRGFFCKNGLFSVEDGAKNPVGHAAVSLRGHDSGKIYFVVGVRKNDDGSEQVLLADGGSRRIDSPKSKKRKHVIVLKAADEGIRKALSNGDRVDDSVIVHALKQLKKELGGQVDPPADIK